MADMSRQSATSAADHPTTSLRSAAADAVGDAEGLRQRRDEYSALGRSVRGIRIGQEDASVRDRLEPMRALARLEAILNDRSALPPSDEPGASDPRGRRDRHSWRFGITACAPTIVPRSDRAARHEPSFPAPHPRRQMPIPASGSSGQSAVRDELPVGLRRPACRSSYHRPGRGVNRVQRLRGSGLLPNRAGSRLLYGGFQTVEALPEIAAVPSPVWQGLFGARCAPGPLRGLCRAHSRATSRLAVNRTRGQEAAAGGTMKRSGVLLLCLCLLGAAGCDDSRRMLPIYQS